MVATQTSNTTFLSRYYALCGIGGILSCGLTHTAVTPLDLVKCRLQVDKEKYRNLGHGFKDSERERPRSSRTWGTFFLFAALEVQKVFFFLHVEGNAEERPVALLPQTC